MKNRIIDDLSDFAAGDFTADRQTYAAITNSSPSVLEQYVYDEDIFFLSFILKIKIEEIS